MTTTASGAKAAFAADYDAPIPYMQRTRDYYQVLGFNPYRWAHFVEVPFTPLRMPLDRARVALITTAAPFQPGVGDQGPGADSFTEYPNTARIAASTGSENSHWKNAKKPRMMVTSCRLARMVATANRHSKRNAR
jgi:hypothetical protein